jgi:hypothetical protein
MTNSPSSRTTTAFAVQAAVAFAVSLIVVIIGEINLPVDAWTRAFLALGTVFLVSSTFTLAKVVRDQQDSDSVVSRIDQARIERMLAEYDPYRPPAYPQAPSRQ